MSLEPVAAALMGYLILGQHLRGMQLAGMACVTLASCGTVLTRPRPRGAGKKITKAP